MTGPSASDPRQGRQAPQVTDGQSGKRKAPHSTPASGGQRSPQESAERATKRPKAGGDAPAREKPITLSDDEQEVSSNTAQKGKAVARPLSAMPGSGTTAVVRYGGQDANQTLAGPSAAVHPQLIRSGPLSALRSKSLLRTPVDLETLIIELHYVSVESAVESKQIVLQATLEDDEPLPKAPDVRKYKWDRFLAEAREPLPGPQRTIAALSFWMGEKEPPVPISGSGDWRVLLLTTQVHGLPRVTHHDTETMHFLVTTSSQRGPTASLPSLATERGEDEHGQAAAPQTNEIVELDSDNEEDDAGEEEQEQAPPEITGDKHPVDLHSKDENKKDWLACCGFFGHDPSEMDNHDRRHWHKIPGLRKHLKPHQLLTVWRILHWYERTKGYSTILCDEMGLGKTLQAMAIYVISARLAEARSDDGTEGGPGLDTEKMGMKAMTAEERNGFLLNNGFRNGPALIVAPPQLVRQWLVRLTTDLDLDLPIGRDPGRKFEIWTLQSAANASMQDRVPGVSYKSAEEIRNRAMNRMVYVSPNPTVTIDGTTQFQILSNRLYNGVILVVPNSAALQNLAKGSTIASVALNMVVKGQEPKAQRVVADILFPFPCTWIVLDEFHGIKRESTQLWQLIRKLLYRSAYPCRLLGLSGTPIQKSLDDLATFINVTRSESIAHWRPEPETNDASGNAEMGALLKTEKELLSQESASSDHGGQGGTASQKLQDFLASKRTFLRKYVDGVKKATVWVDGREIAPLGDPVRTVKALQTPNRFKSYIRKLYDLSRGEILEKRKNMERSQLKKGDTSKVDVNKVLDKALGGQTSIGHFFDLFITATLPGAAHWLCSPERPRKDFRRPKAIDGWDWYEDNAEQIVEGSPKVVALLGILTDMRIDRERHQDIPEGRPPLPKKAVVFFEHPVVSFVVCAYLSKKGFRAVTDVKDGPKKAARLYDVFKRTALEACTTSPDPTEAEVLLTTYARTAEGQDFQRANYVVLMEPSGIPTRMEQAVARVHRTGQTATAKFFDIRIEDNAAESTIRARAEARATVVNDLWAKEE